MITQNPNIPKKVLITRRIHKEAAGLLLEAGFEVQNRDENKILGKQILDSLLPEFDAVLCCITDRIDADSLKNKGHLKIISNMASGLDNIDVECARVKGIHVFNTPGIVTESTADLTVTLAFALLRNVYAAFDFIKAGKWMGWDPEIFVGRTFSALTWGIIGYGNVGQAVAKRLHGFGMNVWFYDPGGNSDQFAEKKELSALLQESDVISVHIPLNPGTKHFIDKTKLDMMKPSALLINMARGEVVNSGDLIHALSERSIGGAALDVFSPEPVPADHPILQFQNVIVTPHIGTATKECRREMAIMAAKNIINNLKP